MSFGKATYLRNVARTAYLLDATQKYLAIHEGDPTEAGDQNELNGGAYAREAIDFQATATAGEAENDALIEFATATLQWQCTHWSIWDDESGGGNCRYQGALDSPITIEIGGNLQFQIGDLKAQEK